MTYNSLPPAKQAHLIIIAGNLLSIQLIEELAKDGKLDEIVRQTDIAVERNMKAFRACAVSCGLQTPEQAQTLFSEVLDLLSKDAT